MLGKFGLLSIDRVIATKLVPVANTQTKLIGSKNVKQCNVYSCTCTKCGMQYEYTDMDFRIEYKMRQSGRMGYIANAICKSCCDKFYITSFEWEGIKICNKYNLDYRIRVEKEGCTGINGGNLQFDLEILQGSKTKALVEFNGRQHYIPVYGRYSFEEQSLNDQRKRDYCKSNNIQLIEVPYTCSTCYSVEEYLYKAGVLGDILKEPDDIQLQELEYN